jgi:hypothetical protein
MVACVSCYHPVRVRVDHWVKWKLEICRCARSFNHFYCFGGRILRLGDPSGSEGCRVVRATCPIIVKSPLTKPCLCRPPHLWFYPNFGAIFAVALLPFYWWFAREYLILGLHSAALMEPRASFP